MSDQRRCPHYGVTTELLFLPPSRGIHFGRILLPVHECVLASTLVERLRASEAAKEIADSISTQTPHGRRLPVFGPDLEPICGNGCSIERCTDRCGRKYVELLRVYGLDESFPPGVVPCVAEHVEAG